MKKLIEVLKANKNILVIAAIVLALVILVVVFNGGGDGEDGAAVSDDEQRLQTILSHMEGVGESRVMISRGEDGIDGVVIVCDGAENIMTRSDILNAVSTALNFDNNIIAIYVMQ